MYILCLQLKTGEHVKYFNTLNLFAYGTYKQYRQKPEDYLDLTPAMQKKLQHLTIVSLAIKNKCIPYEVLLEELEINNVRHLEDVIIEAIYAGKWKIYSKFGKKILNKGIKNVFC